MRMTRAEVIKLRTGNGDRGGNRPSGPGVKCRPPCRPTEECVAVENADGTSEAQCKCKSANQNKCGTSCSNPERMTCSLPGGPSVVTFDGAEMEFSSTCTSVMLAVKNSASSSLPKFTVTARGRRQVGLPQNEPLLTDLWVIGIHIRIAPDNVWRVYFRRSGESTAGDKPIVRNMVQKIGQVYAKIVRVGGYYWTFHLSSGLFVKFDTRKGRAYISVSSHYCQQMVGMCGNANGISNDDYVTRGGDDVATDENRSTKIGVSFKAGTAECEAQTSDPLAPTENPDECQIFEDETLPNNPVADCVANSPEVYLSVIQRRCAAKVGRAPANLKRAAFCDTLQSFAEFCERRRFGSVADWREKSNCVECRPECSDDEECVGVKQADGSVEPQCQCRNGDAQVPSKCGPSCEPQALKMCSASGDPHYRTYDGKVIHFQGNCSYLMTGTKAAYDGPNPFSVIVYNENRRNKYHVAFTRAVELLVAGQSIELIKGRIVKHNGVTITSLPKRMTFGDVEINISFDPRGMYTIETSFKLKVSYDMNHKAFVVVPSAYCQEVEGICGNMNGQSADDFTTKQGVDVTSERDKYALIGNSFLYQPTPGCKSPVRDLPIPEELPEICKLLTKVDDPTNPLVNCLKYGKKSDSDQAKDSCKYDLGNLDPEDQHEAACGILGTFVDECENGDVATAPNWRQETKCPMTDCPTGMVFSFTASGCPNTCGNPTAEDDCDVAPVESCQCPKGKLLKGEECVDPSECKCQYKDKVFNIRDIWRSTDCTRRLKCEADATVSDLAEACAADEVCEEKNGVGECKLATCDPECEAGEECQVIVNNDGSRDTKCICTEEEPKCGRGCVNPSQLTCTGAGDPHYRTFDEAIIHFQGNCTYQMTGTKPGSTETPFKMLVSNEHRRNKFHVAYTKEVETIIANNRFTFKMGNIIEVNGEVIRPPRGYSYGNIRVNVFLIGGRMAALRMTEVGVPITRVTISYDGRHRASVTVSPNYCQELEGICGNINGNRNDDFTTKQGVDVLRVKDKYSKIGNSFKVDQSCADVTVDVPPPVKTPPMCQNLGDTAEDNPFSSCLKAIDNNIKSQYKQDCSYDVANTDGETEKHKAACAMMDAFVSECEKAGLDKADGWRTKFDCPMECPAGRVYSASATACPASCADLKAPLSCNDPSAEACVCPQGQVEFGLDCVPIDDCYCKDPNTDNKYKIGEQWLSEDCQQSNECLDDVTISTTDNQCNNDEICVKKDGEGSCRQPITSCPDQLECFTCSNVNDDDDCKEKGSWQTCGPKSACEYKTVTVESQNRVQIFRGCSSEDKCYTEANCGETGAGDLQEITCTHCEEGWHRCESSLDRDCSGDKTLVCWKCDDVDDEQCGLNGAWETCGPESTCEHTVQTNTASGQSRVIRRCQKTIDCLTLPGLKPDCATEGDIEHCTECKLDWYKCSDAPEVCESADKPVQCWFCSEAASDADCKANGRWETCSMSDPVCELTTRGEFISRNCKQNVVCQNQDTLCKPEDNGRNCAQCGALWSRCGEQTPCEANANFQCKVCTDQATEADCNENGVWQTCDLKDPVCELVTVTDFNVNVQTFSRKCRERLDCYDQPQANEGCLTTGNVRTCSTCEIGASGQSYQCEVPPPPPPPPTTEAPAACAADKPLQCWRCLKASSEADCRSNGIWQNCVGSSPTCIRETITDQTTGTVEIYQSCGDSGYCGKVRCSTDGAGVETCSDCELGTEGTDYKCDDPSPQPPSMVCSSDQQLQCWDCQQATSDEDCYKTGSWTTCSMPNPTCQYLKRYSIAAKQYQIFRGCAPITNCRNMDAQAPDCTSTISSSYCVECSTGVDGIDSTCAAKPTTPAPTEAPTTPAPTEAPTTPAPTEAPTTPAPVIGQNPLLGGTTTAEIVIPPVRPTPSPAPPPPVIGQNPLGPQGTTTPEAIEPSSKCPIDHIEENLNFGNEGFVKVVNVAGPSPPTDVTPMLLGSGDVLTLNPGNDISIEFVKPLDVMSITLAFKSAVRVEVTLYGPGNEFLYRDSTVTADPNTFQGVDLGKPIGILASGVTKLTLVGTSIGPFQLQDFELIACEHVSESCATDTKLTVVDFNNQKEILNIVLNTGPDSDKNPVSMLSGAPSSFQFVTSTDRTDSVVIKFVDSLKVANVRLAVDNVRKIKVTMLTRNVDTLFEEERVINANGRTDVEFDAQKGGQDNVEVIVIEFTSAKDFVLEDVLINYCKDVVAARECVCRIQGDPIVSSCDNELLFLRGPGYFPLAIVGENQGCDWKFKSFVKNEERGDVTIPVRMIVKYWDNGAYVTVEINDNNTALIDNVEAPSLPYSNGVVTISSESLLAGDFTKIALGDCASFYFKVNPPKSRSLLLLDGRFMGKVQGVCGDFDGVQDDMRLRNGTISGDFGDISDSYQQNAPNKK